MLPSGRAAILAYTMPAWAIPLSVLLLGERLTARKLLGLALGMAGMALLVWDEFHRIQGAPRGALLVLGAAFTWAIGTILQKKYPVRAPLAALHGLADAAGRRADLHRRAAVRGLRQARRRQPDLRAGRGLQRAARLRLGALGLDQARHQRVGDRVLAVACW